MSQDRSVRRRRIEPLVQATELLDAHAGPHATLTNTTKSVISIYRDHARNVKNWRNGQIALRWCAAGIIEAGKQFLRINGRLHLPKLRTALEWHVATETVSAPGRSSEDRRQIWS